MSDAIVESRPAINQVLRQLQRDCVRFAMAEEDDILIELTHPQLEQLAAIYGSLKKTLPHLHSFFHICLRSKEMGMGDFVHVYSPGGCWAEDGTFIASLPVKPTHKTRFRVHLCNFRRIPTT